MNRITFPIVAFAAFALFAAPRADAGADPLRPVTHTVFFGDELPKYPGKLASVEIAVNPSSELLLTLFYGGPVLGEPYAVTWDVAYDVHMGLPGLVLPSNDIDPERLLHTAGLEFAGGSSGTAWSPEDDNGFDLRFFGWPPDPVSITARPDVRRFQGKDSIALEWWISPTSELTVVEGQSGGTGTGHNAFGVGFDVTYHPAQP